MQSRWKDADARRAIVGLRRTGRGRGAGAAHLYDAAARAATRAGAARRRQHLAEDRDGGPARRDARGAVRQGLGLGHGGHRPERALPAVRLAPLQEAARARRPQRRGHGARPARLPARSAGAEPVGGVPAARLHAAQVRRPHARQCRPRAWSTSPMARSWPARSTAAAWGSCPTTARASGSPSGRRGVRRQARGRGPDPRQARHLHLRRDARARPTSA